MTAARCGVRYGARRALTCRRLARHPGQHSLRLSVAELQQLRRR